MKTILSFSLLFLFVSCQAPRPKHLGLKEGKLSQCPESPNCINTHFETDKDHYMEPLKYQIAKEEAQQRILRILKNTPRTEIITSNDNYIHAEFTSSIFKFVDDVEFNFSEESLIHYKSASRVGHSDLGANRKRMNELIFRFNQNEI